MNLFLVFFILGYFAVGLGVAIGVSLLPGARPTSYQFTVWAVLWPWVLVRWAKNMRDRE